MPHISDVQGSLRENLLDAGCDPELTERFLALIGQGKEQEALALLTGHRKYLLDCCHAEQKKIDCLDYLLYRMERDQRDEEELLRHPLSKKAH